MKFQRHGHASNGTLSPTYNAWTGILQRCQNAKNKNYSNYGGRGISVCDRWQLFANFVEDMGEAPEGMSLDRINNDGDYTPENCRWATPKQQSNNKRTNLKISYNGQELTVTQWARRLGMNRGTLWKRLTYYGWTIEKSLTTPVRKYLLPPDPDQQEAA